MALLDPKLIENLDGIIQAKVDAAVANILPPSSVGGSYVSRVVDRGYDFHATTQSQIPLNGSIEEISSDYFETAGNGVRFKNFTGWVTGYFFANLRSIGVSGTAVTNRAHPSLRPRLNGVDADVQGHDGYMRNDLGETDHDRTSMYLPLRLFVTPGDVLTIDSIRGSSGSTAQVVLEDPESAKLVLDVAPAQVLRGVKGDQGYGDFEFRSSISDPVDTEGRDGFMHLNTSSKRLFRKFNGNWFFVTSLLSTGVDHLTCEENGALGNNQYEWSHGNGMTGSTSWWVSCYPGECRAMSLNVKSAPTSTCVVEVEIENIGVRTISLPAGTTNGHTVFSSPMSFPAGARFRFRTVTAGGASGGTVSAALTYTT